MFKASGNELRHTRDLPSSAAPQNKLRYEKNGRCWSCLQRSTPEMELSGGKLVPVLRSRTTHTSLPLLLLLKPKIRVGKDFEQALEAIKLKSNFDLGKGFGSLVCFSAGLVCLDDRHLHTFHLEQLVINDHGLLILGFELVCA